MNFTDIYPDPLDPYGDEDQLLARLAAHGPTPELRSKANARAEALVEEIRRKSSPTLMESFLGRYRLSSPEGLALMSLAEALLRVPDAYTADALIADKIGAGNWSHHAGGTAAWQIRAATQGLGLAKKIIAPHHHGPLQNALRRLGAPVLRQGVRIAMREIGNAFVLGRSIDEAWRRGKTDREQGFTHSFDMLGEAAMTAQDAEDFTSAYAEAISLVAKHASGEDIRRNPGISVKLSALHPRYQTSQSAIAASEIAPKLLALCQQAAAAGIGLNIDAEEANRLELSLTLIRAVLSDPSLKGWDGFGVVVQAYGKRCAPVIDQLYALAVQLDRKIMVRLVKGAYWDTEIKQAQTAGAAGFPVFTRKAATDISWLCCAGKLLDMTDRIYPQFATHNAYSTAAIIEMVKDRNLTVDDYEFQRLHGMGEGLFDILREKHGCSCRIYAPVGPHKDLLAYLARRMLENGANSSFVSQIADAAIPASRVAQDPWESLAEENAGAVIAPSDLFGPSRRNSRGADLQEPASLTEALRQRGHFENHFWTAGPILAVDPQSNGIKHEVRTPSDPDRIIGSLIHATPAAVDAATLAASPWHAPATTRAAALQKASDIYEANTPEILALLTLEAGKTLPDAVAELREAVDFLRFYAVEAENHAGDAALGLVTAISPWNFPLAIFTGQIAAALATGNAVLAKPAEATGLIAHRAVQMLHEAGIPASALQLVTGTGAQAGTALTSNAAIGGVVFTGSTATAQRIHRNMAEHLTPDARLIAETGGLNAMIADSTALPEQVVRDVLASAFQSAGQRCSALRVLYLQEDIAPAVEAMLFGAMDQLIVGDPWHPATDIGPVIDRNAMEKITAHIEAARGENRVLHQTGCPQQGSFVPATALRIGGINNLAEEIFGPVLHIAHFPAGGLDDVMRDINAADYGLTFGLHSRIDDRSKLVADRMQVGNIYINRNQIGAIVGSQPFGGEGLSGTGPKAGGPNYLGGFVRKTSAEPVPSKPDAPIKEGVQNHIDALQAAADLARSSAQYHLDLPGPTGETNRLGVYGRGVVLCLGPSAEDHAAQIRQVRQAGAISLAISAEGFDPASLTSLTGFAAVAYRQPDDLARKLRAALAARSGPIIPLLCEAEISRFCIIERHVSVDTTAAGGNAALLAQS